MRRGRGKGTRRQRKKRKAREKNQGQPLPNSAWVLHRKEPIRVGLFGTLEIKLKHKSKEVRKIEGIGKPVRET